MNWYGKKTLLLGLGASGSSAASLLLTLGAKVVAVDDRILDVTKEPLLSLMARGMEISDASTAVCQISSMDSVVVSPGISQHHPCYIAAKCASIPIIGEVELAAPYFSGKYCIGVTGTNGKTSVVLFLEHILTSQGIKALAVGNVGVPMSAVAEKMLKSNSLENVSPLKNDYTHFIIELSSYQLETMHFKLLDCAIILNITPDHLDRYADMDDYALAKMRIFDCLKINGLKIVHENVHSAYRELCLNAKTYGRASINHIYANSIDVIVSGIPQSPLPTLLQHRSSHDVDNYIACYAAATALQICPCAIASAFFSFKKPPHRIEFVAEIDCVKFIDDSKGTNIDAVICAVQSIRGDVLLIAGGVDKGASYLPWVQAFQGKVRAILAIGQAAAKIKLELSSFIDIHLFENLKDAVMYARSIAIPGDTVLLSPGCSSFDQFTDYAHRGREFKKNVLSLEHL